MLCEPGFDSMGFYSLWEGGCRQAEDASGLVLREGKKLACQKWWLLQLCPPSREGGTAVGELMWIAEKVTVLKFGRGRGRVWWQSCTHSRGSS